MVHSDDASAIESDEADEADDAPVVTAREVVSKQDEVLVDRKHVCEDHPEGIVLSGEPGHGLELAGPRPYGADQACGACAQRKPAPFSESEGEAPSSESEDEETEDSPGVSGRDAASD